MSCSNNGYGLQYIDRGIIFRIFLASPTAAVGFVKNILSARQYKFRFFYWNIYSILHVLIVRYYHSTLKCLKPMMKDELLQGMYYSIVIVIVSFKYQRHHHRIENRICSK